MAKLCSNLNVLSSQFPFQTDFFVHCFTKRYVAWHVCGQYAHLTPPPPPPYSPSPLPLSLLSIIASFYGYLKLHGNARSRKKDLWSHLKIELVTSLTKGRPLTICPGACFSKVPIINGPGRLSPFSLKIEVSIVLHVT